MLIKQNQKGQTWSIVLVILAVIGLAGLVFVLTNNSQEEKSDEETSSQTSKEQKEEQADSQEETEAESEEVAAEPEEAEAKQSPAAKLARLETTFDERVYDFCQTIGQPLEADNPDIISKLAFGGNQPTKETEVICQRGTPIVNRLDSWCSYQKIQIDSESNAIINQAAGGEEAVTVGGCQVGAPLVDRLEEMIAQNEFDPSIITKSSKELWNDLEKTWGNTKAARKEFWQKLIDDYQKLKRDNQTEIDQFLQGFSQSIQQGEREDQNL